MAEIDSQSAARSVTFRSVTLGLLLCLAVACIAPFNDYLYHNTYMIADHLPLIVIVVITFMSVVVNPLLGKSRFTTGEVTVSIALMLIACAFPTSGFYRYFQAMLSNSVFLIKDNKWLHDYIPLLNQHLHLTAGTDPGDPQITDFALGNTGKPNYYLSKWIGPYSGWAFFLVPFFIAVLLFVSLMRKQWVVRERLAFPLAAVPLEMMAEPGKDQRFNSLWKNKVLWIGALIPLVIHLYNGSRTFHAFSSLPEFPINYNFNAQFADAPFDRLSWALKSNQIFFSVVGITFFVPLEIAFSIWFFFIAYEFGDVLLSSMGVAYNKGESAQYQGMGIYFAYAFFFLWISRHHLLHVLKSALQFKPREPDEFLPYWFNTFGLLACIGICSAFFAAAGAQIWVGVFVVLLLLYYCFVMTRVVIESGLLFVQIPLNSEPLRVMQVFFSSAVHPILTKTTWITSSFALRMSFTDQRENLMPFAADALRLGSEVSTRRKTAYLLFIAISMFLCLFASGAVHHYISYKYGHNGNYDGYGSINFPYDSLAMAQQGAEPGKLNLAISRPRNIFYGALAMTLVGLSRLFFINSPFHPIGLLVFNSYAVSRIWYSVFIAWLLKMLIVRFGGAKVYTQARPFFMGLLIGESLAGVFWMVIGLTVGWPTTQAYNILPG